MTPDRYLKGGVPILLSSSVTLSEGETKSPDLGRLQNIFRSPMVIDEIRFMLTATIASTEVHNFGGSVRARFKMGRIDLSDQFVPIWLHGPILEDAFLNIEGNIILVPPLNPGEEHVVGHFRWVLPRPLFVPVGNVLAPTFSRQHDFRGGTVNVDVVYCCRRLPAGTPTPNEIDVPFIGVFVAPEMTAGDSGVALSTARDLFNPFTRELYVQRFLGRVQQRTAGNPNLDRIFDGTTSLGGNTTIRIQDSKGYNITRDFVPWTHVFDVNRRAWTFRRSLAPKEWYAVQILVPLADRDVYFQPQISMVGWRKEVMR